MLVIHYGVNLDRDCCQSTRSGRTCQCHGFIILRKFHVTMIMIYSYCAAITILCISLLLNYIPPNKKHYFNHLLDLNLSLNHSMPESDQLGADGSPSLTAWFKSHFGALYHDESTIGGEQSDFQAVFNSTFSESVSIYVNHEQISRDKFESEMKASRSALSQPPIIDWKEILEIPTKSDENNTSAVSIQHPGYPVLSLTLTSGSPLAFLLDFSLSHAR